MYLLSDLQFNFSKRYVKQIKLKCNNFQGYLYSQVNWV